MPLGMWHAPERKQLTKIPIRPSNQVETLQSKVPIRPSHLVEILITIWLAFITKSIKVILRECASLTAFLVHFGVILLVLELLHCI